MYQLCVKLSWSTRNLPECKFMKLGFSLFLSMETNWDLVTCWQYLIMVYSTSCQKSGFFLCVFSLLWLILLEWYLFWNMWHYLYNVMSVKLLVLNLLVCDLWVLCRLSAMKQIMYRAWGKEMTTPANWLIKMIREADCIM